MGNNTSKTQNDLFNVIKETSSYRDFVIRMNHLISKGQTNWSFETDDIRLEELNIYHQNITNFYCFVSDYIYENARKDEVEEKETYIIICKLFYLLSKFSVFLAEHKVLDLYDTLWNTINYDIKLDIKKSEDGKIESIKVEGKDYIGGEDQLTIGMKLLVSAVKLCFKNDYGVRYRIKDQNKRLNAIIQHGWLKGKADKQIVENRVAVLEFFISMIFVEKKFMYIQKKANNSIVNYLQYHYNNNLMFRSFLLTAVFYEENGLIPYSAYFSGKSVDLNLYASALSLNVCLFLLKEPMDKELAEWQSPERNQQIKLMKIYLTNHNIIDNTFLVNFFEDSKTLQQILNLILNHIISFHEKENTLLPNSYKQSPFIEEMVYLLLSLITKSELVCHQLVKLKNDANIIMPLIILMDQIPKTFNNGVYYVILTCLLKLSSCKLKSRCVLP